LTANHVTDVIIVGGTGVVGTTVEQQVRSLGITGVTRVWGPSRYETSGVVAAMYKSAFGGDVSTATGTGFADALTGGVFSAERAMPMLLISPQTGAVANEKAYVQSLVMPQVYIFGGTGALADAKVQTLYP
jgi:putative cell wall-binding protein